MREAADTFYDKMPKEAKASKEVMRLRVINYEEDGDFSNALDCAKNYLEQYPDDEDMTKESEFLKTALMSSSDIDKSDSEESGSGMTDSSDDTAGSGDNTSEADNSAGNN